MAGQPSFYFVGLDRWNDLTKRNVSSPATDTKQITTQGADMKRKLSILLALTFLLSACGAVTPFVPTPTATLTATPSPTRTATPTVTLSPTTTPSTVQTAEAKYVAYQTTVANYCPTTLPPLGNEENLVALSDSEILREFAGVYENNTGSISLSFTINCVGYFAGLSFWDMWDVRDFSFFSGQATVSSGRIYLAYNGNPYAINQESLIPIRWGQRKYLLSFENNAHFFCELVILQKEPRTSSDFGVFLLRVGDEKLEATGYPIYPSGEKICL